MYGIGRGLLISRNSSKSMAVILAPVIGPSDEKPYVLSIFKTRIGEHCKTNNVFNTFQQTDINVLKQRNKLNLSY